MIKQKNNILQPQEDQLDSFTDSRTFKIVPLIEKLEKVNSIVDSC